MSRRKPTGKKEAFLVAFALSGNVTKAAKAAGIHRSMHYDWLDEDPHYAELFEHATEEAADALEEEARRRAQEGVQKLRFFKGMVIMVPHPEGLTRVREQDFKIKDRKAEGGFRVEKRFVEEPVMVPYIEHEYSDNLLMFLLKGVRPEKYRDNVNHDGTIDFALKFYERYDPAEIGSRSIQQELPASGAREASSSDD